MNSIAHRRTATEPSAISAWRIEPTGSRPPKKAEFASLTSFRLRPGSSAITRSSCSNVVAVEVLDEHRQPQQPVGRRCGAREHDRLGEVRALEGAEAELDASLVGLARFDAVGDQGDAGEVRGQVVKQRPELDHAGELEQRLGLGRVVVEGDPEAGVARLADDHGERVVRGPVGLDLEHDPLGHARQRPDGEQELARHVHVRGAVAHQAREADVADRLDEHARRGAARIDRAGRGFSS